jgi:hypothetical protein
MAAGIESECLPLVTAVRLDNFTNPYEEYRRVKEIESNYLRFSGQGGVEKLKTFYKDTLDAVNRRLEAGRISGVEDPGKTIDARRVGLLKRLIKDLDTE